MQELKNIGKLANIGHFQQWYHKQGFNWGNDTTSGCGIQVIILRVMQSDPKICSCFVVAISATFGTVLSVV